MDYTRTNIFAVLRALVPARPLQFSEAQRISELQAHRLRQLLGITTPEIEETVLLSLPKLKLIDVPDLPTSATVQLKVALCSLSPVPTRTMCRWGCSVLTHTIQ